MNANPVAVRAGQAAYPRHPAQLPALELSAGRYVLRFARSAAELDAIQRLRFAVFNLELREGLAQSFASGRDADEFDPVCHHLLVQDLRDGAIVGTYRLQTSEMAEANLGFYSAREFALSALPLEVRREAVELGRACIAREHRNSRALLLLWRGLAEYLRWNRKRWLFGCCSLASRSPCEGWGVFRELERMGALHAGPRVAALAALACARDAGPPRLPDAGVPPLLAMYLRMGARVVSAPALDREFGTIDFLVLFDLEDLAGARAARFLGEERSAA